MVSRLMLPSALQLGNALPEAAGAGAGAELPELPEIESDGEEEQIKLQSAIDALTKDPADNPETPEPSEATDMPEGEAE